MFLRQRGDPLDLDRRAELDLVPGDRRAAGEAGDLRVDLELLEHLGRARRRPRRWPLVRAFGAVPGRSSRRAAGVGDRRRTARAARTHRRQRRDGAGDAAGCRRAGAARSRRSAGHAATDGREDGAGPAAEPRRPAARPARSRAGRRPRPSIRVACGSARKRRVDVSGGLRRLPDRPRPAPTATAGGHRRQAGAHRGVS